MGAPAVAFDRGAGSIRLLQGRERRADFRGRHRANLAAHVARLRGQDVVAGGQAEHPERAAIVRLLAEEPARPDRRERALAVQHAVLHHAHLHALRGQAVLIEDRASDDAACAIFIATPRHLLAVGERDGRARPVVALRAVRRAHPARFRCGEREAARRQIGERESSGRVGERFARDRGVAADERHLRASHGLRRQLVAQERARHDGPAAGGRGRRRRRGRGDAIAHLLCRERAGCDPCTGGHEAGRREMTNSAGHRDTTLTFNVRFSPSPIRTRVASVVRPSRNFGFCQSAAILSGTAAA